MRRCVSASSCSPFAFALRFPARQILSPPRVLHLPSSHVARRNLALLPTCAPLHLAFRSHPSSVRLRPPSVSSVASGSPAPQIRGYFLFLCFPGFAPSASSVPISAGARDIPPSAICHLPSAIECVASISTSASSCLVHVVRPRSRLASWLPVLYLPGF